MLHQVSFQIAVLASVTIVCFAGIVLAHLLGWFRLAGVLMISISPCFLWGFFILIGDDPLIVQFYREYYDIAFSTQAISLVAGLLFPIVGVDALRS